MFNKIIILMFSAGIFMRGILYYLSSLNIERSKIGQISISKSDDLKTITQENRFASKLYMIIGSIVSILTLILIFLKKEFIINDCIVYFLTVLTVDLLLYITIKISLYKKNKED